MATRITQLRTVLAASIDRAGLTEALVSQTDADLAFAQMTEFAQVASQIKELGASTGVRVRQPYTEILIPLVMELQPGGVWLSNTSQEHLHLWANGKGELLGHFSGEADVKHWPATPGGSDAAVDWFTQHLGGFVVGGIDRPELST